MKYWIVLLVTAVAFAQAPADPRTRIRNIRDLARQGDEAVTLIAAYIIDMDFEVRLEAVKTLAEMGGPRVLEPLITATGDNDPEIQIRATDGIVNVYLPGFVKGGLSGTLRRAGNSIRARFTDVNDQVIEPFVQVRADAITALAHLTEASISLDARANGARALGILRAKVAVPQLAEALRSKDDRLMYEALAALGKIGDPVAAPRIQFLLKDLDDRIQSTALEVTGQLGNKAAAADIRDALEHARNERIRRAALGALAALMDPADHPRFISYLVDKDDGVRAAAAEGLGRLRNSVDKMTLDRAFMNERAMPPRLADAFALVALGNLDVSEFAPLTYLVHSINQKLYKATVLRYLSELARDRKVLGVLRMALPQANKEERMGIATVFGRSGDAEIVQVLQVLSMDPDADVASEGLRALRSLRMRLQ